MLVVQFSGAGPGSRVGAAQQASEQLASGISETALAQIDALLREKDSRTPAERKIDSQLLYQLRMNAGQPITSGVGTPAS